MVLLYMHSSKGVYMKNWHIAGVLVILFFAGQVVWYLTSKGII
jgi:hypothetical protein